MTEPADREGKGWLVAGHYGGANTGDDVMLAAVLRCIPEHQVPSTNVIAKSGTLPASLCSRVDMRVGEVWAALKQSRGLVMGGGTHFQDEFSGLRGLRHGRYMVRYVLLAMLARIRGLPVLWLGMGFGPITRASTRWLVRVGSRFCTAITARDAASMAELEKCRPCCEIRLAFDLAPLALDVVPRGGACDAVLGICPVYFSDTAVSSRADDETFWTTFAYTLSNWPGGLSLKIKVFEFRGGDREADTEVCNLLVNRLQEAGRDATYICYQMEPAEVFTEMQTCTHFISARFHGVLLSWMAECRQIAVVYHQKVHDLADEIGLADVARWPLEKNVSAEEIAHGLDGLFSDHPDYLPSADRTDILERAEINRAFLDVHALG